MDTKVTEKQETKAALLQVGADMMLEKGYTNTGIQDVLKSLNVTKGSFYHYFYSKERYALEIIREFNANHSANLVRILGDSTQTPLTRLKNYCQESKRMLLSNGCRKGCLIGNLSQEMADQSEVLRAELSQVMAKWRDIIAECIEEGQKSGEIKNKRAAHDLAELFSAGWAGAILRAKTVKNTESLDIFMELVFEDLLKA
jgi:TetR/AcrR family transcriptional repressor of nem operon